MQLVKFSGRLAILALLCIHWVVGAEGEKLPEPTAAEQKESEQEIHKLFAPPGKDPAEIGRYAKKLLEAGRGTASRPSQQFVLLRMARDLAAGAADVETALAAARALGDSYRVDLRAMEIDVFSIVIHSQTKGASSVLIRASLDFMEKVRLDHDFENALRFTSLAQILARKTDSSWLRGRLESLSGRLRILEQWRKRVEEATTKLAADPKDPAANELLGKFHCLVCGTWETGVPFLVLCDHPRLQELARDELANPAAPSLQFELGRHWWALSEEEKEVPWAKAMQLRAGHWYGAAVANLSGVDQAIARDHLGRLPERFLCDLEELDVVVGVGNFGKRGEVGWRPPGADKHIMVDGLPSQWGLYTHPPKAGAARVKYPLNRMFKRLRTWVALNDTAPLSVSPLAFTVRGDGNLLWKSRPVQKRGQSQLCSVSVDGVVTLELTVECPGSHTHAHAVWLDPLVTR